MSVVIIIPALSGCSTARVKLPNFVVVVVVVVIIINIISVIVVIITVIIFIVIIVVIVIFSFYIVTFVLKSWDQTMVLRLYREAIFFYLIDSILLSMCAIARRAVFQTSCMSMFPRIL